MKLLWYLYIPYSSAVFPAFMSVTHQSYVECIFHSLNAPAHIEAPGAGDAARNDKTIGCQRLRYFFYVFCGSAVRFDQLLMRKRVWASVQVRQGLVTSYLDRYFDVFVGV